MDAPDCTPTNMFFNCKVIAPMKKDKRKRFLSIFGLEEANYDCPTASLTKDRTATLLCFSFKFFLIKLKNFCKPLIENQTINPS